MKLIDALACLTFFVWSTLIIINRTVLIAFICYGVFILVLFVLISVSFLAFLGHFSAATFTAAKQLSPSSFGLPLPLLSLACASLFCLLSFLILVVPFGRIFVVAMFTGAERVWHSVFCCLDVEPGPLAFGGDMG